MANDAHLVIGDVLELPAGADVAEGEDAVHRGLLELIDDDEAGGRIDGDPRGGDAEPVAVGDSTSCDEHDVGGNAATGHFDGDLRRRHPEGGRLRSAEQCPAPARRVRERLGDVVVMAGEQSIATDHLGHLAAEGIEHVGELGGDEPAAEDDHRPR